MSFKTQQSSPEQSTEITLPVVSALDIEIGIEQVLEQCSEQTKKLQVLMELLRSKKRQEQGKLVEFFGAAQEMLLHELNEGFRQKEGYIENMLNSIHFKSLEARELIDILKSENFSPESISVRLDKIKQFPSLYLDSLICLDIVLQQNLDIHSIAFVKTGHVMPKDLKFFVTKKSLSPMLKPGDTIFVRVLPASNSSLSEKYLLDSLLCKIQLPLAEGASGQVVLKGRTLKDFSLEYTFEVSRPGKHIVQIMLYGIDITDSPSAFEVVQASWTSPLNHQRSLSREGDKDSPTASGKHGALAFGASTKLASSISDRNMHCLYSSKSPTSRQSSSCGEMNNGVPSMYGAQPDNACIKMSSDVSSAYSGSSKLTSAIEVGSYPGMNSNLSGSSKSYMTSPTFTPPVQNTFNKPSSPNSVVPNRFMSPPEFRNELCSSTDYASVSRESDGAYSHPRFKSEKPEIETTPTALGTTAEPLGKQKNRLSAQSTYSNGTETRVEESKKYSPSSSDKDANPTQVTREGSTTANRTPCKGQVRSSLPPLEAKITSPRARQTSSKKEENLQMPNDDQKNHLNSASPTFWTSGKGWSMNGSSVRARFMWKSSALAQFRFPIGVYPTPEDNIVVCDTTNHRVVILDNQGELVTSFGREGNGNGEFKRPSAVVVYKDKKIAVKDDHRIQIFSPAGEHLWSCYCKNLQKAYGLALDSYGCLVTLDVGTQSYLYYFSPTGEMVRREAFQPLHPLQPNSKCRFLDVSDTKVVVVDLGLNCVYITDHDGNLTSQFGSKGHREGQFSDPAGVSLDQSGNMFIADSKNSRVQVFSPDGEFKTYVDFGNHPIRRPSDICLTRTGKLLVLNYVDHFLSAYDLES